ncbi:hypothetical protein QBC36DRAFT_301978 [Triangularia setosa]|uniref:BRCT domain-containing protein n=1 Tax=Triangularia setosa TaxID=2587417 RepID=A0AAN6W5C7_9PEZI|nr:hypothetical protein QBC36DRAFT_301978 [Podospora setosa]
MDPQSPPKRVTRARAAAKAVEPASRTTKIMTAAARTKTARGTLTASSASTLNTTTSRGSVKRKSPFDDEEESDHEEQMAAKPSSSLAMKPTRGRGRPKKAADAAPEPVLSTSTRARGRPKKTAETARFEATARATSTKKSTAEPEPAAEPVKKTTTRRPATATTASTAAKSLTKPAVKKSVKFEEPEEENIAPAPRSSTQAAFTAGALNKKPVRRGATATSRTTRTTKGATNAVSNTVSATKDKPLPLSPKKINQLALSRAAESDDELGMDEKVPVRRFKRAPVKPAMGATKALASSLDRKVPTENDENALIMPTSDSTLTLMLGTPAKRLPPSPWKGSIKSPPRRVDGLFSASTSQAQPEGQISPIKCSLLQTPAKRQPLSIPIALGSVDGSQANPSPFKFSLLSSPAKRSVVSPIKKFPPRIEEEEEYKSPAPKPTLLASPMPAVLVSAEQETKVLSDGDGDMIMGNTDEEEEDDVVVVSPEVPEFSGRLSTIMPRHADPALALDAALSEEEEEERQDEEEAHADEAVESNENEADNDDEEQEVEPLKQEKGEAEAEDNSVETIVQETEDAEEESEEAAVDSVDAEEPEEQARSAPKGTPALFQFGLREKDLDPYHSEDADSEDEAPTRQNLFSSAFTAPPDTPCRRSSLRAPRSQTSQPRMSSGRSTAKRVRIDDSVGFTPLASQLNGWTAGPSPLKTGSKAESPLVAPNEADDEEQNAVDTEDLATLNLVPENVFFENEMLNRPDAMDVDEEALDSSAEIETPILEDITPTEEDAALAAEANEMSLMEPEQLEVNTTNLSHDDTISEASQEYGDENELPVDPSLVARANIKVPAVPPVTPARTLRSREVHTVTKVPLKPADESTPRPKPQQRCNSASRLPVSRPTDRVTRSATVISYSPTKTESAEEIGDEEQAQAESAPPVTPAKTDIWSTLGTPARTPRRDLNPSLLRGAVVFVDVHTTEGADASGIFVELLTQMGARCLKEWKWNPTSTDSKIGITHVVYKDGGKRTLEKVRQSEGVVQCVGVSWVLDCERENQWLDEGPYAIDTKNVPRGGARRRKSMEPRAMSNMNGTLIPAPVKGSTSSNSTPSNSSTARSNNQAAPATPASNRSSSRRASSLWAWTPKEPRVSVDDIDSEDDKEHDDDDDDTWDVVLTPVPKTPAPEAIARYVANISPGSDTTSIAGDDDKDDEERKRQEMLTRTCPPKKTAFVELGERVLNKEKDERVLMRLMAARRKSLQFAPKIGSPLAKSWR